MSEQQKHNEEQSRNEKDNDPTFAFTAVALEESDFGYTEGGRILIEDQDGGKLMFRTKQGMFSFCHFHGIYLVTKVQMKKIKKAAGKTK